MYRDLLSSIGDASIGIETITDLKILKAKSPIGKRTRKFLSFGVARVHFGRDCLRLGALS
jgi:hypothetical protein